VSTDVILFLAGIGGGLLAGMLGIGGGIIYIVALPYALQHHQSLDREALAAMVVANSFLGILFASFSAFIAHLRLRSMEWYSTCWVVIPGAIIAVAFHTTVLSKIKYTYGMFNAVVIAVLLAAVLYYLLFKSSSRINHPPDRPGVKKLKWVISGGLSSVVSLLTGLGGAISLIPLLHMLLRIDAKPARPVAVSLILVLALTFTIFNLLMPPECSACTGLIHWRSALPIIAGVVVSAPLGVRISHNIDRKKIETGFIVFLCVVLIQKLIIFLKDL